jgi:hypothetical protein
MAANPEPEEADDETRPAEDENDREEKGEADDDSPRNIVNNGGSHPFGSNNGGSHSGSD